MYAMLQYELNVLPWEHKVDKQKKKKKEREIEGKIFYLQ